MIETGHLKRQHGVALVIVLWMVSLLSVIAAGMSYTFRQHSQLTGHYVEQAKLQSLAEAGIYYGVQQLFNEDQESQWLRDGQQYELSLAGQRVLISLQDERGKIDLNNASPELLVHVIENATEGIDSLSLAHSILDWRDGDQIRQDAGAEDDDYRQENYSYGSRDGDFLSVMELQQLMGVTPELYESTVTMFTIYSRSKGIDPWTVSPQVLGRLPGMTDDQAAEFVESRSASLTNNRRTLKGNLPLATQPYVSGSGPAVYTVTSSVESAHGNDFGMQAVVHVTGNEDSPFNIISLQHTGTLLTFNKAQTDD